MRPASFDEELMSDWSIWVLDNGLPELPTTVEVGWSVPIARWVGETVGAVLHVQWRWDESHEDDEVQSEVELLPRTANGWEYPSGSGGTGWLDPPLVRPGPHRGRYVFPMGMHGYVADGEGPWAATYGVTAYPVAALDVQVGNASIDCPIESSIGAWIVAHRVSSDCSDPAVVIDAFDEHGVPVDHYDAQDEARRRRSLYTAEPTPEFVDEMLDRLEGIGAPQGLREEAERRAATMPPAAWRDWVLDALRAASAGEEDV
jgi:hypothetical protein